MKKRILCVMLTLIMLVSLIPAGAITASAASQSMSEAAITVLKKMTTFKSQCYRVADTQEYRIGYGTVCNEKGAHGSHTPITEKKADALLREVLADLDKKVNSFATTNKLSLKQNQHDALVVFSYGVGTAWMSGNGVVKTAIVGGAGTNELLNAMATVNGNMDRRKVEVNMYVNGVYSNVVPDSFKTVTYDANGGSMAQGSVYTMHYDTSKTIAHPVTPTNGNKVFLGWYDGAWFPNLSSSCAGRTLVAMWQEGGIEPKDANMEATKVSYKIAKSQLASTAVFSRPDGDEDYLLEDAEITVSNLTVFRDYIAPDGARWAQVDFMDTSLIRGWVMVKAGSNGTPSGGSGNHAEIDVTVTVTNSYVNSRKNATVHSAKNGTYYQGAKLRIINTDEADGYLWGQIAKSATDDTPIGWVALMYTNWNSVKGDSDSNGSSNNTTAIATATVTYAGFVRLRSGVGTDNKIVGSLAQNETVDIYEIKVVNGHQWGRTNSGWVCLTYTSLTMLGNNKNDIISNEGALNYVFTGNLYDNSVAPRVSPSESADFVQEFYTYEDEDDKEQTVKLWPEVKESVVISNMVIDRDGYLWVKISWRVDLDQNGKDDTTKYGWLKMTRTSYEEVSGGAKDASLSLDSLPVGMSPARFTVVADEVTVRKQPNSGAAALDVKLNKGVNVKVNAIKLVGESIWGYMESEIVASGDSEYTNCDGWINLASKYVKRSDAPTIEGDENLSPIGKTATVVNTDSVNVRITGSTSGKLIGKLNRGTTANVLEISENGKWYNLDVDVDKNPKTGSWVSKDYLEIKDGYVGGSNGGSNNNNGSSNTPVVTGKGVVANTYAGVNVRQGAGTGYASVGKLLPGTLVDILEMKTVGAAKWGRIDKGWVCMDYITMLSENVSYPGVSDDGSTNVGSYDEIDRTTTTAVYTGTIRYATPIYTETIHWNDMPQPRAEGSTVASEKLVRQAQIGEDVTIYELISVTEKIKDSESSDNGHGTVVEKTVTSYWARVDGGYIFNPQEFIDLDALDEQVHTLTGSETLKVRTGASQSFDSIGKLKKGDQVKVTALEIENNKVWGRIEFEGREGWIRLDYMAEGAFHVQEKPTEPENNPKPPVIGDSGNTGDGGFVNNGSGYRYTGKVINTNEVNVRATASQTAAKTTTLKSGASLVIYETTTAENMAWGRCDAGWVYLYYVDLTPVVNGAVDARVVYTDNTVIYTDSSCSGVTGGTYARMSVIDIYEIVGSMAKTDLGWVKTSDLL